MEQQFELDFGPEGKAPEKRTEAGPESLRDEALAALYKETIGIDPVVRAFGRQTMLDGLAAGRDAERARIKLLDDEENRASIAETHIS